MYFYNFATTALAVYILMEWKHGRTILFICEFVFLFVYLYLCICICAFVFIFVYLYLCICTSACSVRILMDSKRGRSFCRRALEICIQWHLTRIIIITFIIAIINIVIINIVIINIVIIVIRIIIVKT